MLCLRTARNRAAASGLQVRCLNCNDTRSQGHLYERLPARILNLPTTRQYRRAGVARWTFEEEKQLVELRKSGIKFSQIKFHMKDRTTHSILSHFNKLVSGSGPLAKEARALRTFRGRSIPVTKEQVKEVLQLHARGLNHGEIQQTVRKKISLSRIGLIIRDSAHYLNPNRSTPFKPEEDALLVKLVSEGTRWSEIAKQIPTKSKMNLQQRWHKVLQPRDTPSDPEADQVRNVWSQEQIKKMLEMYKQGKTLKTIGKDLGFTDRQVQHRLNRFGISRKSDKDVDVAGADAVLKGLESRSGVSRIAYPDQVAQIWELHRSGADVNKIARTVMLSTAAVRYHLSREAGRERYQAWSREEETRLAELMADGKDVSSIAETLGRTKPSVLAKMQKVRKFGEPESVTIPQRTVWTPDEDKKLEEMVAEGRTIKAIAKEFGRTDHAVHSRIGRFRKAGRLVVTKKKSPIEEGEDEEDEQAETAVENSQ